MELKMSLSGVPCKMSLPGVPLFGVGLRPITIPVSKSDTCGVQKSFHYPSVWAFWCFGRGYFADFEPKKRELYEQLSSYHAGTNRALFFMLPRPQIVQPEDEQAADVTDRLRSTLWIRYA